MRQSALQGQKHCLLPDFFLFILKETILIIKSRKMSKNTQKEGLFSELCVTADIGDQMRRT